MSVAESGWYPVFNYILNLNFGGVKIKALAGGVKMVVSVEQGLQTTAHESNPARETISSGRKEFVNNEKILYSRSIFELVL